MLSQNFLDYCALALPNVLNMLAQMPFNRFKHCFFKCVLLRGIETEIHPLLINAFVERRTRNDRNIGFTVWQRPQVVELFDRNGVAD